LRIDRLNADCPPRERKYGTLPNESISGGVIQVTETGNELNELDLIPNKVDKCKPKKNSSDLWDLLICPLSE
jgi:hypothetical protein